MSRKLVLVFMKLKTITFVIHFTLEDTLKTRSFMKQFILFTLIAACLISCNSSADKTPPADTTSTADKTPPAHKQSDENLALVTKFLTAIENLDTAAMSSLMADNYKGYGPSIGDSLPKSEILENWKYNFDHYYGTIKYLRQQLLASAVTENNDAEAGRMGFKLGLLFHKIQRRKRANIYLGKFCLQN